MDQSDAIVDAVRAAAEAGRPLVIAGSGTKRDWLPPTTTGELLTVDELVGIEDYQPAELVVTARAGTPLRDIELVLAKHEQMFAFEPPQYYGGGTLGGALGSGHSGPNRPWGGALRDAVLGVEMVNGRGERLSFGGQVMKNVAGYDVSRLQAGAYGALGVVLSVSLRVQPRWERQATLLLPCSASDSIDKLRAWARQPLPLAGSCWHGGELALRLAGDSAAVQLGSEQVGGDVTSDHSVWQKLRDQQHPFFKSSSLPGQRERQSLWRISAPPAAELPVCDDADLLIEWAGGVRWLWHDDPDMVKRYAADVGGWAWRLGQPVPIEEAHMRYMAALKQAFDPEGLFVSPLQLEAHAD